MALDYDGDRAEVVREHGHVVLSGTRDIRGGPVLTDPAQDRVASVGIGGGRFVVGGLLPEGACRAVVIDAAGETVAAARGGGAWLAVVAAGDRHEPPVRFDDADGEPVRPPLPEEWAREPVADAAESCPACGAIAWEQAIPTDFARGSQRSGTGPEKPSPVVVCTRCGHEEVGAVSYALPGREAARPVKAVIERYRRRRRREELGVLRRAGVTLYALAGDAEPRLSGWGGPPGRVERVTVSHERGRASEVSIRSAALASAEIEDPVERARQAFFATGPAFDERPPKLSPPALTLWLRARERAHAAALLRVEPSCVEVAVDGAPVAFVGFRRDGLWAIAANLAGARVTATGTDWPLEGLELRSLANPADEVAPWL